MGNLDERIMHFGGMMKTARISMLDTLGNKVLRNGESMQLSKPINNGEPLQLGKKEPTFAPKMLSSSPYNPK
jgi:hypothetical protein